MTQRQIKAWFLIHKWASLICTLFLLLACITGLPLIFSDEINQALDGKRAYSAVPAHAPLADLDKMVGIARERYPHDIIRFVFADTAAPRVVISLAPSWEASIADPKSIHGLEFDASSGALRGEMSQQPGEPNSPVMEWLLKLHTELLAGLAGELILAAIGALFVAAIVSGIALYAPFMRKLDFGTVRAHRARRARWLDLHNLLGIVTSAWALCVGLTGVMNALSTPLFNHWQRTHVQAMLTPYAGQPALSQDGLVPVQRVFEIVAARQEGLRVFSIVFPGARLGSPHHYMVWAKGTDPVTAHLFSPALVDAKSGEITAVVKMPWYLKTLELSRPLHFGDYGGLPLKILWALLDLASIVVLGSGLYLWFARRKSPLQAQLEEIETGGESEPLAKSPP